MGIQEERLRKGIRKKIRKKIDWEFLGRKDRWQASWIVIDSNEVQDIGVAITCPDQMRLQLDFATSAILNLLEPQQHKKISCWKYDYIAWDT